MKDKNFEVYKLENSKEEFHYHLPSKMAKTAFFYLLAAGETQCAQNYQVKRHDNKSLLLMFVEEGTICGKCQNKEFMVHSNEILFLNCMNNHEYHVGGKTAKIMWFHFYGATSIEYYNILQQKFGNVIQVSKPDKVRELFEEMLNLNRNEATFFEFIVSYKIVRLMTTLYMSGIEKSSSLRLKNQMVETIVNYIKENYEKKICIKDIARKTNYNYYYISHVFKEIMGESVYEYASKFRIDVAKRMLVSDDYPIKEIGERIGYNTLADFIRNFKKREGISPLKYRLSYKNSGEEK